MRNAASQKRPSAAVSSVVSSSASSGMLSYSPAHRPRLKREAAPRQIALRSPIHPCKKATLRPCNLTRPSSNQRCSSLDRRTQAVGKRTRQGAIEAGRNCTPAPAKASRSSPFESLRAITFEIPEGEKSPARLLGRNCSRRSPLLLEEKLSARPGLLPTSASPMPTTTSPKSSSRAPVTGLAVWMTNAYSAGITCRAYTC